MELVNWCIILILYASYSLLNRCKPQRGGLRSDHPIALFLEMRDGAFVFCEHLNICRCQGKQMGYYTDLHNTPLY